MLCIRNVSPLVCLDFAFDNKNPNSPRQHFLSANCPLLAGLPPISVFHFEASSFPEFEVSCPGGGETERRRDVGKSAASN